MKGGFYMKGFLKIVLSLIAFTTVIVGALVVTDKLLNKNRIKGDYLECDTEEDEI
jgi:hypothetical protein